MPRFFPFRGWRYNPEKVNDIGQTIAPPYDVITPAEQEHLYARSPYNFVRLILNKAPGEQRYHEAARFLREWEAHGIVVQEPERALYLMDQSYRLDGEEVTRSGIVGALQLEELGGSILPHEQTIDKHIQDRFRLMEESHTNPGQIFMSYRDQSLTIESVAEEVRTEQPIIDVRIPNHARYRLWKITTSETLRKIQRTLESTSAIIADGHHRYKTALRFFREYPDIPGSNRVMVTLVNAYNPGMLVLPTHRLVKDASIDISALVSSLRDIFAVEQVSSPQTLLQRMEIGHDHSAIQLGMYHKSSRAAFLLTFLKEDHLQDMFPDTPGAYQRLDVNVLHHFILKQLFQIDTDNQESLERLNYIRGCDLMPEMLEQQQDYDLAFFVNPPDLDAIFAIAESGRILPQKTTYFYPKIYSGILFRCFGAE